VFFKTKAFFENQAKINFYDLTRPP